MSNEEIRIPIDPESASSASKKEEGGASIDPGLMRKKIIVLVIFVFGGPALAMILMSFHDYMTLRDLYHAEFRTFSDQVISLDSFEGKILVVIIFSEQILAQPSFLKSFNLIGESPRLRNGVEVLGINEDGGLAQGNPQRRWELANLGFTVLQPEAKTEKFLKQYRMLPTVLIFDRTGRVIIEHRGMTDISQILNELRLVVEL